MESFGKVPDGQLKHLDLFVAAPLARQPVIRSTLGGLLIFLQSEIQICLDPKARKRNSP